MLLTRFIRRRILKRPPNLRVELTISLSIFALVLGLLTSMYFFRSEVAEVVMKPLNSFAETTPPAAPDYTRPDAWAVLPGAMGPGAEVPEGGTAIDPVVAPADTFFVHTTFHFTPVAWNGRAHDKPFAMRKIEDSVMANMTSTFNGCCRVYAPRYRQATMYAFLDEGIGHDGQRAIDLAYEDVRRAFFHYLETWNDGRPFILASHSQGSWHLQRLIVEEIQGTPLADRMVVAYVPGYATPKDVFDRTLTETPLCTVPDQTKCILVWNTFGEGGDERNYRENVGHRYGDTVEIIGEKPLACVNPATWLANNAPSPWEAHQGMVAFDGVRGDGTIKLKGKVQAQCENGILRARVADGLSESAMQVFSFPNADWHPYDWGLFYMNIRANADLRIKAWQTGRAKKIAG